MPKPLTQQECFDALKAKIAELSDEYKGITWLRTLPDWYVMRYVDGHKNDVDEAWKMMTITAAWRVDYHMDTLLEDYVKDESKDAVRLKTYYPIGKLGRDDHDRPVALYRLAMVDFPALEKEVGLDAMVKHMVYLSELNLTDNPNKKSILVIDLGYNATDKKVIDSIWKLSPWISANQHFLKAMVKVTSPAYPEMQDKILFLRAPTVFWGAWNVVKWFLPEATRDKVAVLSGGDPKDICKHIPLSCIPDYLGGGADTTTHNKGGPIPISSDLSKAV